MAGTNPGFDAANFRTQIQNTMIMGLNSQSQLKPTFYFQSSSTYPAGTHLDGDGKPIDARIQATVTSPDPVQVPAAVEFVGDSSNDEDLTGTYRQTRVLLTLLDTDYAQVDDAIEVDIDAHRYVINDVHTVGLFDVNVYQLACFRKGVEES